MLKDRATEPPVDFWSVILGLIFVAVGDRSAEPPGDFNVTALLATMDHLAFFEFIGAVFLIFDFLRIS